MATHPLSPLATLDPSLFDDIMAQYATAYVPNALSKKNHKLLIALAYLAVLVIADSGLSDISILAGLTTLTSLHLNANDISDISPIVENQGIGNSDTVYIEFNPLDCDDPITLGFIDELEARRLLEFMSDCRSWSNLG